MTINVVSFLSTALNWGKAAIGFALPVVSGPLGWALGFLDTLWNSQMGRIVIVAASVFVGTWFWCWTSEHAKITAAVKTAVEAQNNEWKSKIAAANSANEAKVTAALAMGSRVPPVLPNTDLVRLCKADPSCRSAVAKK